MSKRIFLDYASSTPVDEEVLRAMESYWRKSFAHPWSQHREGKEMLDVIEQARADIAQCLHVHTEEIVFTSGGTEANTLAIKGVVEAFEKEHGSVSGMHCLISIIEHPAVRDARAYLERKGMMVDIIPVTQEGIVDIDILKTLLTPETLLISIGHVNGEIGTVQPLTEVRRLCDAYVQKGFFTKRTQGPLIHTDASQASLAFSCSPYELGVDVMTLDAHKIYGPKGVGALYIKKGIVLEPLFFESRPGKDIRGGTPPVPLIVGFAKALQNTEKNREQYVQSMQALQEYCIQQMQKYVPGCVINGSLTHRAPNNLNIFVPHIESAYLVLALDAKGIAVSTTSACLSSGGEGSYVVGALYPERANHSIRITFGKDTTRDELDTTIIALAEIIETQKR